MRLLSLLLLILIINGIQAQDSIPNVDTTQKKVEFKSFIDTVKNINLEMVAVTGGSFLMGSNKGDDDEIPIHTVRVDDFYIGKFEVTQAQWSAIMDNNLSCKNNGSCPDCPIECISWNDVQEFLIELNNISGKKYRLPTEAEWEYAAGGYSNNRTIWGGFNTLDSIDYYAWYYLNSNSTSHRVGQKQANKLGLYDISGNIYEWCSDWYSTEYYSNSTEVNPQGPKFGTKKVIRGGAWGRSSSRCRVANRDFYSPANSYDLIGFRLVLSAE